MGGSAFNFLLTSSFPRLPPPVYHALKARLTPVLQQFYVHVAVPAEAPEKIDHGDLDFVVFCPRNSSAPHSVNVPHEVIKAALGATHCILEEGNRTSNFAIAIDQGAWGHLGCTEQEEKSRQSAGEHDIYCQVSPLFTRLNLPNYLTSHRSLRSMYTFVRTRTNGNALSTFTHTVTLA